MKGNCTHFDVYLRRRQYRTGRAQRYGVNGVGTLSQTRKISHCHMQNSTGCFVQRVIIF